MAARRSQVERRVLDAIDFARRVCPSYANGTRPARSDEIERLCRYLNVQVRIGPMDHPCILMPPIGGKYQLLLDEALHWGTRDYVIRHELGHLLAGDADEPTLFHFTGPLPEAEDVADLFAFADLLPDADLEQGRGWVETRMRDIVTVAYEPFYLRLPRLAPRAIRLAQLRRDWVDNDRRA